jgi:hypothetical protein
MQAPLGTYTGWNIRKVGFSEGDSCDLTGAFIPFFETQAQRLAAGDPRPSLQERYPTHAIYVASVTAAANQLVKQRLLLQQDASTIISQAALPPFLNGGGCSQHLSPVAGGYRAALIGASAAFRMMRFSTVRAPSLICRRGRHADPVIGRSGS